MKLILILISFFLFQNLSAQEPIRVLKEFYPAGPTTRIDSFFYNIHNNISISFDEGFDDSVIVTINDTVVLNEYLKTNEFIGYAGGTEVFFKDSSEIKILQINFIKAKKYIKEKINFKYKLLQVRGLRNWSLVYSNHFDIRE